MSGVPTHIRKIMNEYNIAKSVIIQEDVREETPELRELVLGVVTRPFTKWDIKDRSGAYVNNSLKKIESEIDSLFISDVNESESDNYKIQTQSELDSLEIVLLKGKDRRGTEIYQILDNKWFKTLSHIVEDHPEGAEKSSIWTILSMLPKRVGAMMFLKVIFSGATKEQCECKIDECVNFDKIFDYGQVLDYEDDFDSV